LFRNRQQRDHRVKDSLQEVSVELMSSYMSRSSTQEPTNIEVNSLENDDETMLAPSV